MPATDTTIVCCTWHGATACTAAAIYRAELRHAQMAEPIVDYLCERHAALVGGQAGWTLARLGGQPMTHPHCPGSRRIVPGQNLDTAPERVCPICGRMVPVARGHLGALDTKLRYGNHVQHEAPKRLKAARWLAGVKGWQEAHS